MQASLVERLTFAAGEISPVLRQRSDLAKTQTALWFAENVVVLPEGGVTRRPGTSFLAPLKDPTQAGLLIPFRFAPGDVAMLVFNAGVMRLFVDGAVVLAGGAPYELAIPYAAADLANVRFAQIGSDVYIACDGHPPQLLVRNGADTNWTIGNYLTTGGPVEVQNLDQTVTIKVDALTGVVNLTGTNTTWDIGLIGGEFKLSAASVADVTIWTASEAVGVGGFRQFQGNVYENMGFTGGGTNVGLTPPTHTDGDVAYTSNAANTTVIWRFLNPGYGYVRITGFTDATHMQGVFVSPKGSTTWQLPVDLTTTATYRWFPPSWSADAGWPDRVMIYQERILWLRGNEFWLSTNTNLADFDVTALPASAIAGRITSDNGALPNIEWASQNGGIIIVGGHDGEYQLRGASPFDALTVANIGAVPSDSSKGSCAHMPARADGGTLFLGRNRKKLYHLRFQPLAQTSDVPELTLFARHLLAGQGVRIAWQADPHGVAWICCADGTLVSITFNRDQQVTGCARHPTAGFVEDVACVQSVDDITTQLYLIVRRVINGVTTRYVEMLAPYTALDVELPDAGGAWFLDCAAQYVGASTAVIGGLSYLTGETVYAHADGAMQGPFTVNPNGQINLAQAAANVVVGKAIAWRARTLPFNLNTQKGPSKGARKKANEVLLDVVNSGGGEVTVNPQDGEALAEMLELTGAMAYGGPVSLFTGTKRVNAGGSTEDLCVIEVGGSDTMPFTLAGISPDVILEGQP